MAKLSVTKVSSQYQDKTVLDHLCLTVESGEILALLGPSGCGKTTLLRAICGLQPISSGKICVGERLLSSVDFMLPSEQRGLGMIFQDYALFPHLSVADNIGFGLKSLKKVERQQRVAEMLELVKLDGLGERFPHELSGGQQQRVSIARALAYKPDVLLLDEPFSNIDAQVRSQLMQEIREILKQQRVTAIFVTHSKDEAFEFADRLALFKQGRIVQTGTPEQLYFQPAEPYVAEFLGQGNYLEAEVHSENQVVTPLGLVTSSRKLAAAQGEHMRLLLRPQQIQLAPSEQGPAVIRERRFLGNYCYYTVELAEHKLQVRSQQTQLELGQSVSLSTHAHPLVLFPNVSKA
ncbi:ABC transporter ATP-binding protein [Paraferrimonas sedimenticola]|uniref:ABC transporter n=1 Tax=Paraferrimonas sedimenticola TaxID=375674 RepID=A0AA37VZM1_9GAMM|nr:ABC transporter ATP-binding protein [Paraferrimonas sedimenticola]GLP97359.1 ABC transporter [Paraferrimonas sedimenticola]